MGPGQLPGRPHVEGGVRVQGDDKLDPFSGPRIAAQGLQTGPPPAQQAAQLQQRAPLALPAHPALICTLKGGLPKEKVKAASVFPIEGLQFLSGPLHPGALPLPHRKRPVRQIGQQPKKQLFPASRLARR